MNSSWDNLLIISFSLYHFERVTMFKTNDSRIQDSIVIWKFIPDSISVVIFSFFFVFSEIPLYIKVQTMFVHGSVIAISFNAFMNSFVQILPQWFQTLFLHDYYWTILPSSWSLADSLFSKLSNSSALATNETFQIFDLSNQTIISFRRNYFPIILYACGKEFMMISIRCTVWLYLKF